jgi:hypothetical protein
VISQFFRTCLPELRARLACLWGFLISQPSIGVASSLKVYQMKWIEMVEGGIHHDPIGYVPRKGAHPFTIFLQLVADDLGSRLQPARTRAGAGQGRAGRLFFEKGLGQDYLLWTNLDLVGDWFNFFGCFWLHMEDSVGFFIYFA